MFRGLLDQPWGRRWPWPRWLNREHWRLGQANCDQSRSSMTPSWRCSRCPNMIADQTFERKGVGVTTRIREFFEEVFHPGGQLGQTPGFCPVLELEVGPEILEHFDEMRLTGPEEATHP